MPNDSKTTAKLIQIKQLHPESYHFWVFIVKSTLQIHDLLYIILDLEFKLNLDHVTALTLRKIIT